jgi:hypothetical protein
VETRRRILGRVEVPNASSRSEGGEEADRVLEKIAHSVGD